MAEDAKDRKRQYSTYPILWAKVKDVLALPSNRKRDADFWLGICGFSKRVCKIKAPSDLMSIMVIHNLYIEKGRCEEREGCLDYNCPLNRTTWESFKAREGLPKKTKKPPNFGERPIDYNGGADGELNDFSWLFEGRDPHAPGGILTFDEKGEEGS
jgi:hypothetical protein